MKMLIVLLAAFASGSALADTPYLLKLTNGGAMPVSPGVLYASSEGVGTATAGQPASPGFVQLCQTGNNMTRNGELKMNRDILSVVATAGPIMPGESRTFEIMVPDGAESLNFEAMYGKTKDVCGVINISRHGLVALKGHVTAVVSGRDQVLASGAFVDPTVSAYADQMCSMARSAVECLRALAGAKSGMPMVRVFSGYLPSLTNYLESKYGAMDVLTLQVPSSGALSFQLMLKH